MNFLNFFKLNVVTRIRVFFLMFILLFISAIPVYSLDWKDKEWIEAGCPLDIFGQWVSIDVDTKHEKLLSIEQNKIRAFTNQSLEQEYLFKTNGMDRDARFVNLKLMSNLNNKKKNLYLKIRPHLVHTETASKNLNISNESCLIKVFEFESKNNAKFDKYLHWDIYKLKK